MILQVSMLAQQASNLLQVFQGNNGGVTAIGSFPFTAPACVATVAPVQPIVLPAVVATPIAAVPVVAAAPLSPAIRPELALPAGAELDPVKEP
jgi:hypothetical protein